MKLNVAVAFPLKFIIIVESIGKGNEEFMKSPSLQFTTSCQRIGEVAKT